MNIKRKFIIIVIPLLFFVVSFLTISDYGISWDEPAHFMRGQAYLNYFLTGNLDYQNLKPSDRQSPYQHTSYDANFFLKNDSGHPPVNGILAALTNYVFYQKLGILGDIESLHLFNILASTLLVFIVTIFAVKIYGPFAGLIAGIGISVYPLFFSEGHFNIKDPAETAFFSATIWCFYNSLNKLNWKWLLASIIFFALALGTKFNIFFLPFILFPWLFFRYKCRVSSLSNITKIPRFFLLFLILSPIIVGVIFFFTWPYLWNNSIHNVLSIFKYYGEIGTGGRGQANFLLPGGFNSFPVIWIAITTPPVILFFTIIGIIYSIISFRKEKEKTSFLWLLWLIVPILRVSVPNSSIYGGIRQIMEFIPAMALLTGLGAITFINLLRKIYPFSKLSGKILAIFVILMFVPHLWVMKQLHPNENVYFNSFIGGLPGAQKANIPYWGNSFGNAYLQAVNWLNINAPPNSKLALLQKVNTNISPVMLREDINYYAGFYRSGILREGEFIIELTHRDAMYHYPYIWEYINNFLDPVYEVKVDGVAIAKVWQNDFEHTKPEMRLLEVGYASDIHIDEEKQQILISLENVSLISRIKLEFSYESSCGPVMGEVLTSKDDNNWTVEPEKLHAEQLQDNRFKNPGAKEFFFPGREAKYIKIILEKPNLCFFNNPAINVLVFDHTM